MVPIIILLIPIVGPFRSLDVASLDQPHAFSCTLLSTTLIANHQLISRRTPSRNEGTHATIFAIAYPDLSKVNGHIAVLQVHTLLFLRIYFQYHLGQQCFLD